jgi:hypothetical protein
VNTVSFDKRQFFAQHRGNGNAALSHLSLGEYDDFTDRFVDLKGFLPLRRCWDEVFWRLLWHQARALPRSQLLSEQNQ